jgi:hypothetical protein
MTKVSKSPDRNTFQKEGYLKRCAETGEVPSQAYIKMWEDADADDDEWAQHEHGNDLEYDLRSTDWILEKARNSDSYAQNIYAALCNMQWCNVKGQDPKVTLEILKENFWSCSWRSAGGIVANMQQKGDYIDWYCSGIGNDDTGYGLTHTDGKGYVPEGHVTDEIREDLRLLGWVPVPWPDEK